MCLADQTYSYELHKCIKKAECKADEFYDDKLKTCVKKASLCNSQFEYYDQQSQQCIKYNFITSPYLENLVYTKGDFNEYIKLYQQRVAAENLKDCPLSQPYYDIVNNKCIDCPSTNPYFDLEKSLCIKCSSGYVFNPYEKKCKKMAETTYP